MHAETERRLLPPTPRKDLWPYRMTMEKDESARGREGGKTRETILFLESDSLGARAFVLFKMPPRHDTKGTYFLEEMH